MSIEKKLEAANDGFGLNFQMMADYTEEEKAAIKHRSSLQALLIALFHIGLATLVTLTAFTSGMTGELLAVPIITGLLSALSAWGIGRANPSPAWKLSLNSLITLFAVLIVDIPFLSLSAPPLVAGATTSSTLLTLTKGAVALSTNPLAPYLLAAMVLVAVAVLVIPFVQQQAWLKERIGSRQERLLSEGNGEIGDDNENTLTVEVSSIQKLSSEAPEETQVVQPGKELPKAEGSELQPSKPKRNSMDLYKEKLFKPANSPPEEKKLPKKSQESQSLVMGTFANNASPPTLKPSQKQTTIIEPQTQAAKKARKLLKATEAKMNVERTPENKTEATFDEDKASQLRIARKQTELKRLEASFNRAKQNFEEIKQRNETVTTLEEKAKTAKSGGQDNAPQLEQEANTARAQLTKDMQRFVDAGYLAFPELSSDNAVDASLNEAGITEEERVKNLEEEAQTATEEANRHKANKQDDADDLIREAEGLRKEARAARATLTEDIERNFYREYASGEEKGGEEKTFEALERIVKAYENAFLEASAQLNSMQEEEDESMSPGVCHF